jgi:hypothetical protein
MIKQDFVIAYLNIRSLGQGVQRVRKCCDIKNFFRKATPQSGVNASYSGSKTTRVPILKVHINGKINTIMEKKLKTNVWWDYMAINQLIKSM